MSFGARPRALHHGMNRAVACSGPPGVDSGVGMVISSPSDAMATQRPTTGSENSFSRRACRQRVALALIPSQQLGDLQDADEQSKDHSVSEICVDARSRHGSEHVDGLTDRDRRWCDRPKPDHSQRNRPIRDCLPPEPSNCTAEEQSFYYRHSLRQSMNC